MGVSPTENARTHDDYTVGWVCALPKEQVAAIAMLDERHESLPRRPNDRNTYSLGSIGNHNVVIACLPKGMIGAVPAAVVAKDMVETFPSIRIPLMVGIGGGVPVNKVRLGDIVVSVPEGPYPGVVQCDFGKATDGGSFERTGSLDKPPASLLTAISKLEADYELGESKMSVYLEEIKTKFPKLVDKYLRSAELVDVLFKAKYSHVKKPHEGDEEECEEDEGYESCKYCDKSQSITRKDREMKIHYGLIASGNQVIKDATHRDNLNKFLGGKVLCIEMEAAGLMDHFPCLVVRGICDYADSHKNKAWQEHAAAVAAAFAKEVLHCIPPREVQMERPVKDIIQSLSRELLTVGKDVVDLKLRVDKSKDAEILDWLTEHDYGFQYSDFLKRRQPGTGQWLLKSEQYQRWRETPNQTLFCPGIPGAGKTLLASIIIEDLYQCFHNGNVGIAYIFCNFRRGEEQHLEDLTASLLKQLSQGQWPLPESLRLLYERHMQKRTRPGFDELLQVLSSTAATYSRLFIIIDALDECQISKDCRNKFLDVVFSIQKKVGLNLCATSRHISEIEERFIDCTTLQIRADAKDIQRYLYDHIPELPLNKFIQERPHLQRRICSKIINAADGVFLLAQLHLDSLKDILSENGLLKALESLVKGSDAYKIAYSGAMDRIRHQIKGIASLAEQILMWITYSRRPMTVSELRTALSIQEGALTFDKRDLIQTDMVSICAGLVTIDEGSSVIRLIHYTVQEYFESTKDQWFPKAQQTIANVCSTYLSFQDFSSGICLTDEELEERLQAYPLYDYAASHWGHHSSQIESYHLVLLFLNKQAQVEASNQVLLRGQHYSDEHYSQGLYTKLSGSHLAAIFGLEAVVQAQRQKWDLDKQDSFDQTPLSWAAQNGHESVVQLLLEAGADISLKDRDTQTPLSWAARNGHEGVVQLLLEAGAEISLKDRGNRTPLFRAARNGHVGVVQLLLKAGAEINLKDRGTQTPLSLAAQNGHKGVVQLLLEAGAEINLQNDYKRTPLLYAARNRHEGVVQLLLEAGAKINLKDEYKQTPLSCAAQNGHKGVVQLLLKAGAEINSKDRIGQTPLSWAARNRRKGVVQSLLEAGAEIDLKDQIGQTPLSWAARNGHIVIVLILLDSGADYEAADSGGLTALGHATFSNDERIESLLISAGAKSDDLYGIRALFESSPLAL